MDTPSYLWNLLEEEIIRIEKDILKKVATKYNIDYEEIEKEFLDKPMKMIPNKDVSIVIKKEVKHKIKIEKEDQCCARVWNRGKGGQWTRKKKDGEDYCTQHINNRKHGDITDLPDRTIFPKKSNSLYK